MFCEKGNISDTKTLRKLFFGRFLGQENNFPVAKSGFCGDYPVGRELQKIKQCLVARFVVLLPHCVFCPHCSKKISGRYSVFTPILNVLRQVMRT